jgi:branched-chain amino acid transport system permease protein
MARVNSKAATRIVTPPLYGIVGAIVLATAALVATPLTAELGTLSLISEILVVIALAQMWNLLAGYSGLLSLGHQGFIGAGAYFVFIFSNWTAANPFLSFLLAGLFSGALALAVAPFLFRLREAYFAIGIWVLAEIARLCVENSETLGSFPGLSLDAIKDLNFDWYGIQVYWLAVAVCVASIVSVYLVMRSRVGLALLVARDNERAASSIGVNVWRGRLVAFVLSAVGCGYCGAVFYLSALHVDPSGAFDPNWVVIMLFVVVIGGVGTIEGPFFGTAVYFVMREMLSFAGNWYLMLMGAVAVVVMLVAPGGIWGLIRNRFGIEIFSIRRKPPETEEAVVSGETLIAQGFK